jgi:mono/diheme cytochrome c family protein
MRAIFPAVLLAALAATNAAIAEQDAAALRERGKALLTEKCSRCHQIGTSGASPFAQAPPFWTIMRRYSPQSLEEALAEGLSSGHEAMPEFVFEPHDIAAIVSYLATLRGSR